MTNTNSNQNSFTLLYLTWWGLMLGMMVFGLHLLFRNTGWIWEMWSPAILSLSSFFIFLIVGFFAIYTVKKKFPNYYPFRKVFAYYLWITFVASLVMIAHDYWFHFIAEPGFDLEYLKVSREKAIAFKENMSEDQLKAILKNIDEGIQSVQENPTTILNIIIGRLKYSLVFTMISGFVITTLMRDVGAPNNI